jgi:hypothetical protein
MLTLCSLLTIATLNKLIILSTIEAKPNFVHLIKCFINMHRNVSGFNLKHATKDTSKSFKVPYYSLFMCCIKGNMQFQKVQHFKLNRIMHVIVGFSQVCSNKAHVYLVNSSNSFIVTNFFYRCK